MTGAEEVAAGAVAGIAQTAGVPDMSLVALFMQASMAVKGVVVLLLLASFWAWTVTFAKCTLLKKLKARAGKFEDAFWNCGSIEAFFDRAQNIQGDPFSAVFVAGMKEWHRTKIKTPGLSAISTEARVNSIMSVEANREIDGMEKHVGFLATVGSTAPFVGLFGTICGIINSFEAIGISQNTNLASVAPGIAEALFATALGLLVTIPAVIAYNKISGDIARYQRRLEGFIDEFSAIISRQLEDTEA